MEGRMLADLLLLVAVSSALALNNGECCKFSSSKSTLLYLFFPSLPPSPSASPSPVPRPCLSPQAWVALPRWDGTPGALTAGGSHLAALLHPPLSR